MDTGSVIPNREKKTKKYAVYLLDDDYTHMDFVVKILEKVFFFSNRDAYYLMLQIHNEGKCFCGEFTKDIALMKQEQVHSLASLDNHPFQCIITEQE